MRKGALAGDHDYLIAAQLFVAEAQQHAAPVAAPARLSRRVADEHPQGRFQQDRVRAPAFVFWWLTAVGATIAVTFDHGQLLDALGYRRRRSVRDVLFDFAAVARPVLG